MTKKKTGEKYTACSSNDSQDQKRLQGTKSMSYKTITLYITLFSVMGAAAQLQAQNATDALRYSSQYPSGGAASISMPGAGIATDLGLAGTLENPASAGLFDQSGTYIGYSLRNISESGTYLGVQEETNENYNSLANIGFVYKFPTRRGSFVFGGGYTQTNDYDRAVEVGGYNESTTITDTFNQSGFYGDAAFNAFAIDSIGDRTQSVFRFGGYRGIQQDVQILESGQMGEVTGFLATEYQKNLFFGISLNVPLASYTYERTFIERDSRNRYTADGPTYSIDEMVNRDVIEADVSGFRARVGMIYKIPDYLNIGVNYQFRSVLTVNEDYRTFIETTFKTGPPFNYSDDFTGEVSYKVESPARLSAGVAIVQIPKLTITASGEWVNYGNMKMKWADNDADFGSTYFQLENDYIEDAYKSVINLEGGLSYQVTPAVRPYIGYAYYPDPLKNSDADRSFLSGGVTLGQKKELNVNIGVQYAMWEDQRVLYEYESSPNNFVTEAATEDVGRLQVIIGLSYRF